MTLVQDLWLCNPGLVIVHLYFCLDLSPGGEQNDSSCLFIHRELSGQSRF